jgi:putative oxidoreductase
VSTNVAEVNQAIEVSKPLNIILWAIQLGVAGMFFMAGASKLTGNEQMVQLFQSIGIGQWFRYVTGLMEVTGALLLLIPSLSGLGGLLLTGVMAGALATHFFVIGGDPTMAIVLLVASAIIAWGRKNRTLALIKR